MVSFIVFILKISILALGIFCLAIIASPVQIILNFVVINPNLVALILFGLFALLIIFTIFFPELKQLERETEKHKNDSLHSTAQAFVRTDTVSNKKEKRSDEGYRRGETCIALTKDSKQEKIEKVSSTVNVETSYKLEEIYQLIKLEVKSDSIFLEPEEEQMFEAFGFDLYDNPIDCGEIVWSATGGTIDQNGKLVIHKYAKGIYQVTATSKYISKYSSAAKTTLLTLGVSTIILSWAIANQEFFDDILSPLLNLTNENNSRSEIDTIVQEWILEIGRRRVAKLLKKASNLSGLAHFW